MGAYRNSPTHFQTVPSEQKPINFFRKVAVGEARKSRKFSKICFLRLLNLCKVHVWDWNYYVWVCTVVPNEFHRSSSAVDLEWPWMAFCVTVLDFCRQNCHRHKCTAETVVSGDIMFYGIIVHPLNHFRLSKLSTANCGIQTAEFAAW